MELSNRVYLKKYNNLRYYSLADVFFGLDKYDSVTLYAMKSLKSAGGNLFLRKNCCLIIVNAAGNTGDIKLTNRYISKCSIRIIESQTKATAIEKQHNSKANVTVAKQNLMKFTLLLIVSIVLFTIIGVYLHRQSKRRKLEIKNYRQELNSKQVFVSQNISKKIEKLKSNQSEIRKNILPTDRIILDKKLYYNALHIDDWEHSPPI